MTRVLRVELLIVNHDNLSDDEVRDVIENTRYPNYCINPRVMNLESREVDWTDEHPLNKKSTQRETFEGLFDES